MGKRLVFLGLTLFASACAVGAGDPPDSTPTDVALEVPPAPTVFATPQPPPTILQPQPCAHLLWPLADGASWSYQLSRTDGSIQAATLSAAVSEDSATLTLDLGAGSTVSAFSCAPDGIYGGLSGLVGHPDLGAELALANPDRPFMPSPDRLLPLGTTTSWDAQYAAGGTILLSMATGIRQATVSGGEVVLYATAQPLETISVPAGTFNTLPVEQSVLFNLQVTTDDGQSGSVFGDAESRLYWAEGVGLVRQLFEGGMLSSTIAAEPILLEAGITLDLLDHQVPDRN